MRALIVDDSREIREIIAAYLRAAGYPDPVTAENAHQALGLLGVGGGTPAQSIDVVLMDIIMPGMDGIEACGRIKRDPPLADTPVLMVSSRDDTESLQQAFLAGASDYIRKPIERVELLARIRSALRLKAELDRRRRREEELREELENQRRSIAASAVDQPSGLPTRVVAEAVAIAAAAARRDFVVLFAEIDGLLTASGAMASDEIRTRTAAVARIVSRETSQIGDLVAVAGPGRLVAVLLDRAAVDGMAFGERWRQSVQRAQLSQAGARNGITTVSVGVAECAEASGGVEGVLNRASRALAVAGARGGNRVEFGA